MKLLPKETIHIHYGCAEKINSYLILADYGFPVLKSVYVTKEELGLWGVEDERKAKRYLNSSNTMLRYIYRQACYKIKDGE